MATPGPADEIELKFQVPPGRLAALRRAVATRSAETLDLRARYFDTDDGRLAAARLAWRLRHEGGRWVQTLKGPGDGLAQRLEHEVPRDPADGDPPAPDAALHADHPAGAALARALKVPKGSKPTAVAVRHGTEIRRTRRVVRHHGARIEIALDEGAIVAGDAREPIAELELELLSGPTAALLDLAGRWAWRFGLHPDPATKSERAQWLLQGGTARPVARGDTPCPPAAMPMAQARATLVAAALAHALPNAAAVTEARGRSVADHVHQLRVALRRLRSVLRALGPVDAERDAALTRLFAALGGTRDADVLALTLAPVQADAAASGIEVGVPASASGGDAMAALASPGTTQLWLRLLALAMQAAPAGAGDQDPDAEAAPWGPAVHALLSRWHRRARRDAGHWETLDEPTRHRLRKRLKRLRYLLEFAAGLLPAKALRAELAALRSLQDTLGRWNDLVVARAAIAGLAEGPGRDFAAGWLAAETRHADAACAREADAWRRLGGRVLDAPPTPRRRRPR